MRFLTKWKAQPFRKPRCFIAASFIRLLLPASPTGKPFLRPRHSGVALAACISACLFPHQPVSARPFRLPPLALRLHSPFAAAADTEAKPRRKTRRTGEKSAPVEIASSLAGPQSPLVRVCLLRYAGASQITVSVLPGAHLLDAQGRELAAGTGPWTFRAIGSNVQVSGQAGKRAGLAGSAALWRVQSEDSAAQMGVKGSESKLRHYRGSLEVRASGGELRLINEVGIEPYLQGVVISEIGDGPLEALKAQVIAARTYAISSRGRWKSDGYDLRDSVDSQAYGGIEAETADGNRAVQDTLGQILTVRGQAIDADFCDDCGGVTAPGDDPNLLPLSVSDALAHRYARHAPYGVWTLTLSPARLKTLVGKSAKARGQGELQNVEIAQRDVSGRAARVRFTWGTNLPVTPSGSAPASSVPSLPGDAGQRASFPSRHAPLKRSLHGQTPASQSSAQSSAHSTSQSSASSTAAPAQSTPDGVPASSSGITTTTEISGDSLRGLIGYNVLRSTMITVRRAPNGDFVFEGRGWGHGHGLCQQGALALAAAPLNQDCKTILAHYYPGARLGVWTLYEEEGAQK